MKARDVSKKLEKAIASISKGNAMIVSIYKELVKIKEEPKKRGRKASLKNKK